MIKHKHKWYVQFRTYFTDEPKKKTWRKKTWGKVIKEYSICKLCGVTK